MPPVVKFVLLGDERAFVPFAKKVGDVPSSVTITDDVVDVTVEIVSVTTYHVKFPAGSHIYGRLAPDGPPLSKINVPPLLLVSTLLATKITVNGVGTENEVFTPSVCDPS
jgi:hypothetical protein